jgi:hypothetical protein
MDATMPYYQEPERQSIDLGYKDLSESIMKMPKKSHRYNRGGSFKKNPHLAKTEPKFNL